MEIDVLHATILDDLTGFLYCSMRNFGSEEVDTVVSSSYICSNFFIKKSA